MPKGASNQNDGVGIVRFMTKNTTTRTAARIMLAVLDSENLGMTACVATHRPPHSKL